MERSYAKSVAHPQLGSQKHLNSAVAIHLLVLKPKKYFV